jgi:hypothetical protein
MGIVVIGRMHWAHLHWSASHSLYVHVLEALVLLLLFDVAVTGLI